MVKESVKVHTLVLFATGLLRGVLFIVLYILVTMNCQLYRILFLTIRHKPLHLVPLSKYPDGHLHL